jgi:hypothetical protein
MFLPVGGVKKLKNESFCTVFVIVLVVPLPLCFCFFFIVFTGLQVLSFTGAYVLQLKRMVQKLISKHLIFSKTIFDS